MLHEINDKNFITPYEQFAGAHMKLESKKHDQAFHTFF